MKKSCLIVILTIVSLCLTNVKAIPITGKVASQEQNLSIFVLPSLPLLTIISPQNITYSSEIILLNYTARNANTIWYALDTTDNITITSSIYFTASEGSHILYLYANNSAGSVTKNVSFSIQIPQSPPPTGGAGGGSGGGTTIKKSIEIDKEKIKVKLKQGETKKENLTIKNIGDKKLKIFLSLENLRELTKISEEEFELSPNESKTIILEFTAKEETTPELYVGNLIVKTKDVEKKVLLAIEVVSKIPLFDIKAEIPIEFLQIMSGEDMAVEITLYKLRTTGKIALNISYEIKNENATLLSEQETKNVELIEKYTKFFRIPENASSGIYVFYAKATYEKETASSSEWFEIGEEIPKPTNLKAIIILLVLIIILLLLFLALSKLKIFEKKKKKRKKKRKK